MQYKVGPRALLYPTTLWLLILAVLFITEYAVMLVLAKILPGEPSTLVGALIDSLTITAVLAPVIWWTLVRPLREVIRLRTKFLGDLFAAIENERRQTAYELHDGIGQELSLLISGLKSAHDSFQDPANAARCHDLQRLAQSALKEVRRIALGLRPSLLNDLGLVAAVEKVIRDFKGHTPVEISLKADSLVGIRLADTVETTLFRIIQEGLSNVVKHSGARNASVELVLDAGWITLTIRDDGHGFDPREQINRKDGHMGLMGMRERSALLGGSFFLESSPGKGSCLCVTIPAEGHS